MTGLSVILVTGLLLFIITGAIKKRFPPAAMQPFTSATDILSLTQILAKKTVSVQALFKTAVAVGHITPAPMNGTKKVLILWT